MLKKVKQIAIFLIVFLISMGVFEYFFLSLNQAQASNIYTSDISFYKDAEGIVRVKFFVNTSFDIPIGAEGDLGDDRSYCRVTSAGYYFARVNDNTSYPFTIMAVANDGIFTCNTTFHYTAGNYYDNIIMASTFNAWINKTTKKPCVLNNCSVNHDYIGSGYFSAVSPPTSETYFQHYDSGEAWPQHADTEHYFFLEYPTLAIDFPLNNAEISGPFTITGTLTQPSPYTLTGLTAIFYWYDENNPENEFNFITGWTNSLIATSSQAISFDIENLPKSDPQYIGIRFTGSGGEGFNFSESTRKIKTMYAVGEWPPPSWEGPNVISFFNTGEIDIYSPTPIGGSYYIKTPTSTITFILTPEIRADNNIWMYEQLEGGNSETVLATSTIESLTGSFFGIIWNRLFDVEGIFAETSTPAWLTAIITSKTGTLISQNNWRILGADEQKIGDYGFWGNFINQQVKQFLYIQPETKQAYYSLGDTMKTKIPLCYFYQIKNSFMDLDLSTSTTPMPGLHLTVEGQDIEINLMDTSFLETTGFMNTFKDLQRMFFWLMFLVFLYILGKGGPKYISPYGDYDH